MPVSSLEGRAAFTVRLPRVATTLVRELLRSVSSAAGVIYEAEFFGLRPAPNIDFSVDWPQVARHLAEAFAADRLASADEIARAVDELIERAAVRLLIHAGAEAELATQRADARHYTAEFITSAFFVPALSPDSTHGPAYYHQPPPDDRLPALDINAFVGRRRVVAQGTLSQLLGAVAQGAEELIAMVDLGALYRTKDVEVHAFLPDDVEAVEVSLEYGARRVALSLRAQEDRVHVRWPYDPSPGLHYRYRYEVLFKPSAPAWTSNRLLSPTETADTTILVIDPRHLYPPAPAR
jgi:hypothetical protein